MDIQKRRERIFALAEADPEYREMEREYETAKRRFTAFVAVLPKRIRNLLWSYPGMGYFLRNKLLDIVCEEMCFPEEVQKIDGREVPSE